mmetsp:Transcript_12895/g.30020  ORF Transcript_12895/g.30020 Transcript_12895/m.30020 type:complete len:141 (+) Transcript_12895:117-539(+)
MDMTDMSEFPDASFQVVIDKAAMDAIMVKEGDVWNPNFEVVHQTRNMCHHVSRILVQGGIFLCVSFAQPHFRTKYLLGLWKNQEEEGTVFLHPNNDSDPPSYSLEFGWSSEVEPIGGKGGCFHHYLYKMKKESPKGRKEP